MVLAMSTDARDCVQNYVLVYFQADVVLLAIALGEGSS